MKIYSFEFGSKAVKWYLNNYNDMNFIGTTSFKFPGNRTFIRLDNKIPNESIKFEAGTYFAPAITIDNHVRVSVMRSNKNPNQNNVTLYATYDDDKSNLAIVTIDPSCYKLIGYWLGSDHEDGQLPRMIKVFNTPVFKSCVIDFDIITRDGSTEAFDVFLYNRLFRKYEFYRIFTTGDELYCDDVTEDYSEEELNCMKKAENPKNNSLDFIMNDQ